MLALTGKTKHNLRTLPKAQRTTKLTQSITIALNLSRCCASLLWHWLLQRSGSICGSHSTRSALSGWGQRSSAAIQSSKRRRRAWGYGIGFANGGAADFLRRSVLAGAGQRQKRRAVGRAFLRFERHHPLVDRKSVV